MWSYPALEEQPSSTTGYGRGLLVVAPDGRIHFAAAPARACLGRFFRGRPARDHLPPELCRWLGGEGVSGGSFVLRKNGTSLQARVVQLDAEGLLCVLLEEKVDAAAAPARKHKSLRQNGRA